KPTVLTRIPVLPNARYSIAIRMNREDTENWETKQKERAGRRCVRPLKPILTAKTAQAACLVSIARLSSAIEPRLEKVTATASATIASTTTATRSRVTPPSATVVK